MLPPVTITQPPWAKRDYSDDPVMRGVPPPIGWFLRIDDPDSGMPPIFTFLQAILAAGPAAAAGPQVARQLIETPVRFAVAEARAGASVAAAGSIGSGTGRLGATLAAETANAARGTWTAGTARGAFTLRINQVGGKLYTTRGIVSQSDFVMLVDEALFRGEMVNILTGVHGTVTGRMTPAIEFYIWDVARFNRPVVITWNVEIMTTSEITQLLNSTETTFGAFCYSGACLRPYMTP